MGDIKIKNDKGEWVVVAAGDSKGISTKNPKLIEDDSVNITNIDKVLESHKDKIDRLERNVSWLALHGGGGGTGGGGGITPSEVTCNIKVNDLSTNNTVILSKDGLTIKLDDISVNATKNWIVKVNIGTTLIYTSSASFTSKVVYADYKLITPYLNNHKGKLTINASYEDEQLGVYGSSIWNGDIIESIITLNCNNINADIEDGSLVGNPSLYYYYSTGLIGDYKLKITVKKDNVVKAVKEYDIKTVETTVQQYSLFIIDILDKWEIGVYEIESVLYNKNYTDIYISITNTIAIVSNTILITTTSMSEDINAPTEVVINSSIIVKWTAYLKSSDSFRYSYYIDDEVIKENELGYFTNEITDYISTINKPWVVINKTSKLKLVVTSGVQSVTKIWYIKYINSNNSFIDYRDIINTHTISNFIARVYNNGENNFELANNDYLSASVISSIKSNFRLYNVNNRVGIKQGNFAPYLRISNGSYGIIDSFKINNVNKNITDILKNKSFTISVSFKADYHHDDNRTIFSWGTYDGNDYSLLKGVEINVHNVCIQGENILQLVDNVVNNIDIVVIQTQDPYFNEDGIEVNEIHHIVKVYQDGALSAIRNYSGSFIPTNSSGYSNTIYIGGKLYNDKEIWLCDCNIYGIQIYDTELNDYDVTIKDINNKVASTYKNGEFNFDIINNELRKNFCERQADGSVISHIFQNDNYTIDFLLNSEGLDQTNINSYAKVIGIPIMFIDVSGNNQWTFDNFVAQQSKEVNDSMRAEGITISYWDPTQNNNDIIKIQNSNIALQGTSTLADAVKNINITVPDDTVFIPKSTWLPEQTYTLKADVVDSSHSNNAAIGKFINEVLDAYMTVDQKAINNVRQSPYVSNQQNTAKFKHTIEGFPILLIMKFYTGEIAGSVSTTPLGIYSFNLGRDAFRNLGFVQINSIKDKQTGELIRPIAYPYVKKDCIINESGISNTAWIEIKDTSSISDMDGITKDGYPEGFNSSLGDFWQTDPTIVKQRYEVRYPANQSPETVVNGSFVNFVNEIASLPVEGLMLTTTANGNIAHDDITTPYDKYRYEDGYINTGTKQIVNTDPNDLRIGTDGSTFNIDSMYNYFIIATFFGLIDNFGKNATFRIWDKQYYIGFYDLDTALGGDNQGNLSISTSAWLKYFINTIQSGELYGYVGETFNKNNPYRKSNTVYSANHNKLWLSLDTKIVMRKLSDTYSGANSIYAKHWDMFRDYIHRKAISAGYDNIVDYFVDEYYIKQTGDCGSLLFNLDYKLKYLLQFQNNKYTNTKDLNKLHGRKKSYTRYWLKQRVLFLDSLFYWRDTNKNYTYPNDIRSMLSGTVYKTPASIPFKLNTDLILYHSVGNQTATYYYVPKGETIYVNAGSNASDSVLTWACTNAPQVIQIGNEAVHLSEMNIGLIKDSNNANYMVDKGLIAITDLDLENNTEFSKDFSLDSFIPVKGNSELRSINMRNTNSRVEAGSNPQFELKLTTITDVGVDSKFNKLTSIDISGSKCISNIKLPLVPLKEINISNSYIKELELDNQNLITNIDLTGCIKLTKIIIKECALYDNFEIDNLVNLTSITLTNNPKLKSIKITNCPNLISVVIENNTILDNITINNCKNLTGLRSDNYLAIKDNTALTSINLKDNSNLEKITIENSNQSNIKTLNLSRSKIHIIEDGIFDTNANPKILNLKPFTYGSGINVEENKGVIEIQYANNINKHIKIDTTFQGCDNLERVYGCLDIYNTNGVYGTGTFKNCRKFSIHGDDPVERKALGVKTWHGKSTRWEEGIRTIYGIITDNDTNVDNRYETGIDRHPYYKVTWNQSFVSGDKVTNLKLRNIPAGYISGYLFSNTHLTEFDIMYVSFILNTCIDDDAPEYNRINYYRTCYPLIRKDGEVYPFEDKTVDKYGIPRFLFLDKHPTYMVAEFYSNSNVPIIARSRTDDYDSDTAYNNGTLCNFTHLGYLCNFIIDNNAFNRGNGKPQIIKWIGYQTILNIVPANKLTYEEIDKYNTGEYSISELGDFTDLFANNNVLTELYGTFNCKYINFDTIKLPKSIKYCRQSFRTLTGSRGIIKITKIFNDCKYLRQITNSFTAVNNSEYFTSDINYNKFPITSDMFKNYPLLEKIGYDPQDSTDNIETYSFKGAEHYIDQDTFPYDIVSNNHNLIAFNNVFRGCKDKVFTKKVKLPSIMFANNSLLQNIAYLFADVNFEFELTSNGFANCKNLNNIAWLFKHDISSTNRSKLTGEIPAKLFYHGDTTLTKTVYGSNAETMPTEEVNDLNTILKHTFTYKKPNANIKSAFGVFYGCLNLEYYTNKDNINMIENNPDYSPFKWNYDTITKTWSENKEHKSKIGYWGYIGDPNDNTDINSPAYIALDGSKPNATDCKYLDIIDTSKIKRIENDVPDRTGILNYMCSPDLLRYYANNVSIYQLFDHCGLDFKYYGYIKPDEDYQSAGITGRIPPYLLKENPNVTSLFGMFRCCRRITGYNEEGIIYMIPKDFFNYTNKITELRETFCSMDIAPKTNLGVFNNLKGNLDIRQIFSFCRYFKSVDNTKQTIQNVFKNNTIFKITGAFSDKYLTINGDYNATEREYWDMANGDKVELNNNFTINKIPLQANVKWVYAGHGINAKDSAIPQTNNNY